MVDALWQKLRGDLEVLGWRPETIDGVDGLSSPNDAVFVSPSQLRGQARMNLIEVLRRKVATIKDHIDRGTTPASEVEPGLKDFERLLSTLEQLAD